MFRALTCPSSGGKTVFTQHLVSSLYCAAVYRERRYQMLCVYTIGPPEDGHVNARNMSRIVV